MHTYLNNGKHHEFLVCAKMKLVTRAILSPEAALKDLDLLSPYWINTFAGKSLQTSPIPITCTRERRPEDTISVYVWRVRKPSMKCYFYSCSAWQQKEPTLCGADLPGITDFRWKALLATSAKCHSGIVIVYVLTSLICGNSPVITAATHGLHCRKVSRSSTACLPSSGGITANILNEFMTHTCKNLLSSLKCCVPETKMAESASFPFLNEKRGRGYSSRFRVSSESLPPGWRQVQKSPKYTVWYDDEGNRYKSSIKVEHALKSRGFITEEETESETGGETSEYEPSPIKKSRKSDVWVHFDGLCKLYIVI